VVYAPSIRVQISCYDRGEVSLKAELLFRLPDFAAGIAGREIIHFKNRSDFDVSWLGLRVRTPLHPVDGLIKIFDLPNPKTRHEIIRVWKGARRYRRAAPSNRTRAPSELAFKPSAALMIPALASSSLNFCMSARSCWLGKLAGFRILRCLDDHHDFHWLLLSLVVLSSACFPLAPTRRRYIPPIALTSMTSMVDCGICR
jgi:hypothetical protein